MNARTIATLAAALAAVMPAGAQPQGPAILGVAAHGSLGDYVTTVVNTLVRAVYMYTPDTQGRTAAAGEGEVGQTIAAFSRCSGVCRDDWPIVTTTETAILENMRLDPALVGAIVRPDGATQVTYNGWPLYRFVGDSSEASTAGHGFGGIWYLLDPMGVGIGR